MEQAEDRAGGKLGNKGDECAIYCNKNDRFCLEFTKIVVSLHRN